MRDVVLSSTRLQALGEAAASLGPYYANGRIRDRYVRDLLERRRAEERERAERRRKREARWAAVAAGEREPLPLDVVLAMHSDFAGVEAPRLVAPKPKPAPARVAEPSEPCVTVNEAAEKLGLRPATLRQRVLRGAVRAIRAGRGKVLVPVAEVERLRATFA